MVGTGFACAASTTTAKQSMLFREGLPTLACFAYEKTQPPKGEKKMKTDRLRAMETVTVFIGMVAKATTHNRTLELTDFTGYLEKQFAEIRESVKEGEEEEKD